MSGVLRVLAMLALLACAWPEFGRYRAERALASASAVLAQRLQGDAAASARVPQAIVDARRPAFPADRRAPLLHGIALLLAGRPDEALATLDKAVAEAEHPELVLNLGRARAATGDEHGARVAFLRSAWAAPSAVATLPAAVRAQVLAEVAAHERELRAGRLDSPPPLR